MECSIGTQTPKMVQDSPRRMLVSYSPSVRSGISGSCTLPNVLKDYPFRDLLFWTQLLYGFSGMLDLVLVLRLNLKFGIPDYFFVVIDESLSQMIGRLNGCLFLCSAQSFVLRVLKAPSSLC
ncbi:hypothetical protein F8388_023759 [Cannabis sativa]|uniref:Uncharacterized protein n=1 Tax=Cannabis sativa TaxID=3483 RepID=A0A7J6GA86_CANSA|nr:hypothetical protein F8388_023759 [Cannabis sativa]